MGGVVEYVADIGKRVAPELMAMVLMLENVLLGSIESMSPLLSVKPFIV